MNKGFKIVIVIALFVCLALIRWYETLLFYDPLLSFFKTDFNSIPFPEIAIGKLMGYTSLRYWLNTIISLVILFVAFRETKIIKFSLLLYSIAFVILMLIFMILLNSETPQNMFLFYIRRFLIQPLFVLILLPAFYYFRK